MPRHIPDVLRYAIATVLLVMALALLVDGVQRRSAEPVVAAEGPSHP